MSAEAATTLEYDFVSRNPHDTFEHARPWHGRLGSWDCVLEDSRLRATASERFASDADARASLDPLLRAWEAAAFLRDQYEVNFWPASGVTEHDTATGTGDHVFRRLNETYPEPDPTFTRTVLVERLLELNRGYRAQSVALPAAVGELVEAFESTAAETGARSVATAYNIDPDVVDALTELAGRAKKSSPPDELSYRGPEWQWMQEALRLWTLQAGRMTTVPPATPLRMEDFKTSLWPS